MIRSEAKIKRLFGASHAPWLIYFMYCWLCIHVCMRSMNHGRSRQALTKKPKKHGLQPQPEASEWNKVLLPCRGKVRAPHHTLSLFDQVFQSNEFKLFSDIYGLLVPIPAFNFTFQNCFKRKSIAYGKKLFLIGFDRKSPWCSWRSCIESGFSGYIRGPSQESNQRGPAGNRVVPHSWLSWFGTPITMVYIYHDKSIVNGIITL